MIVLHRGRLRKITIYINKTSVYPPLELFMFCNNHHGPVHRAKYYQYFSISAFWDAGDTSLSTQFFFISMQFSDKKWQNNNNPPFFSPPSKKFWICHYMLYLYFQDGLEAAAFGAGSDVTVSGVSNRLYFNICFEFLSSRSFLV